MEKAARSAHHHFRLRWSGFCLLLSGIALLLYFVVQLFDNGSIIQLILSFVSCGLSLGSFGINHDTAIAYSLKAQSEGAVREGRQRQK